MAGEIAVEYTSDLRQASSLVHRAAYVC